MRDSNKEKILLITGCSHAAGHEIDGSMDSDYNRQHSFGNILANKLGRTAVNISIGGSANTTIARTTLEWITQCYNPETTDLMVLVAWTESARVEAPIDWDKPYVDPNVDWRASSLTQFLRINPGTQAFTESEKTEIDFWKKFIPKQHEWLELYSLNLILQLQYFFKMQHINYLMTNTGYVYKDTKHTNMYHSLIDHSKYKAADDFGESFYKKYKNLGYVNPKAKWWHHDEIPHALYSDELYSFVL